MPRWPPDPNLPTSKRCPRCGATFTRRPREVRKRWLKRQYCCFECYMPAATGPRPRPRAPPYEPPPERIAAMCAVFKTQHLAKLKGQKKWKREQEEDTRQRVSFQPSSSDTV
jgi:hypothetical protein